MSSTRCSLAFAVLLGFFGPGSSRGASGWLALVAALACNAAFHVRGMVRPRRYSPGVATGVLLYLPLCAWGYAHFLSSGLPPRVAAFSFVIGAAYQFWSASNHSRRSATA